MGFPPRISSVVICDFRKKLCSLTQLMAGGGWDLRTSLATYTQNLVRDFIRYQSERHFLFADIMIKLLICTFSTIVYGFCGKKKANTVMSNLGISSDL